MTKRLALLPVLAAAILGPASARAEVNIGIQIGVPAPPPRLVVVSPPPVVVVPGTPVQYVPSAGFNLFVYGGKYYSFHEGAWFSASTHNGPWAVLPLQRVPIAVRGVPVQYYKIPPGHAKEHGRSGKHRDRGCPPGLAKRGRC